jgi:heme A synthase
MRARFATIALVALLIATALPFQARADGDPASDVLLGQNVYYPYSPAVSASLQKTLDAATAAAAKAHFPIKVAIIGQPVDLGVIPSLFGQPQKYANFLDQEISFQTRQPLLVVMAAGFGVQGLPGPATAAVGQLQKPASGSTDELAKAATAAVAKLAAAAGHPLKNIPAPGGSGTNTTRTAVVVVLVLAALATAGALVGLRRRQAAETAKQAR